MTQEESVALSEGEDDKLPPQESFLGRAYHSNVAVGNDGDVDVPEQLTDYSQVVASELLSPESDV